jgi:hypothetical protein
MINKIVLKESDLRKIVRRQIKNLLKESVTLDEITYKGHLLKTENFNMKNPEDKQFISSHKNEIWDILQKGYEKLGGFKGFEYKSDMMKKSPIVRLGFCDGEIVTVTVYNDYLTGNKCVGATCVKDDRHDLAAKLLELIFEYNIKHWNEWVWIEASGKIEEMCKKLNGFNVPTKFALLYLNNVSIEEIDTYHYTRTIGGMPQTKTIFGFNSRYVYEFIKKEAETIISSKLPNEDKNDINEDTIERNNIYRKFLNERSKVYYHRSIVNYFIYLKYDELINEYPKESINILKKSIDFLKNALKNGNTEEYTDRQIQNTIEDGEKIIKTSTLLVPLAV